mmetsp:Transcript_9146/g.24626  ORF Transcript_9146/g.24626 Transcript_9146/m.24626 type:complete len:222 (-) Transcript_9146:575-1240(-)
MSRLTHKAAASASFCVGCGNDASAPAQRWSGVKRRAFRVSTSEFLSNNLTTSLRRSSQAVCNRVPWLWRRQSPTLSGAFLRADAILPKGAFERSILYMAAAAAQASGPSASFNAFRRLNVRASASTALFISGSSSGGSGVVAPLVSRGQAPSSFLRRVTTSLPPWMDARLVDESMTAQRFAIRSSRAPSQDFATTRKDVDVNSALVRLASFASSAASVTSV